MAWSGIGVNYKAVQANWSTDMAYFNSIGLTNIRPNLSNVPTPWAAGNPAVVGSYAFWRFCAQTFANAGFWVTWGPSGPNGTITAANWPTYVTNVLAEAAYCQSIGLTLGAFELGNEMEGRVDGTTMTIAQLISNIGSLATQVQAVYTLSPISYSCYDTNDITYTTWISTGLGGLDYLAVHPYSNEQLNGRSIVLGGFYPNLAKVINHFGPSKTYISEWGLDANDQNLLAMPTYLKMAAMRDRYQFIKNLGFTRATLYTWCGYLNTDNQFAMQKLDGSLDPTWDVIVQDDKRLANITYNLIQPIPLGTFISVSDTEAEVDVVADIVRGGLRNPNVFDSEAVVDVPFINTLQLNIGDTATPSDFRQNLVTNPSFEVTSQGTTFWSTGNAGVITGLTSNLHDATFSLFGGFSASFQQTFAGGTSSTGQIYLNTSSGAGTAFFPVNGSTYVFSAYVFIPTGSPVTKVGVGIRDWNTFAYVSGGGSETNISVTPNTWTRVTTFATATTASQAWRITIGDPLTAGGFTGTTTFYVDGTQLEIVNPAISTLPTPYFDGSIANYQWDGSANNAVSETSRDLIFLQQAPIQLSDSDSITESVTITIH